MSRLLQRKNKKQTRRKKNTFEKELKIGTKKENVEIDRSRTRLKKDFQIQSPEVFFIYTHTHTHTRFIFIFVSSDRIKFTVVLRSRTSVVRVGDIYTRLSPELGYTLACLQQSAATDLNFLPEQILWWVSSV